MKQNALKRTLAMVLVLIMATSAIAYANVETIGNGNNYYANSIATTVVGLDADYLSHTNVYGVSPLFATTTPSAITVHTADEFFQALGSAVSNHELRITLANDITINRQIRIVDFDIITLDTSGHTLDIRVSGPSNRPPTGGGPAAVYVNNATLRVVGGGSVNVFADTHIALDVQSSFGFVGVDADTRMNLTNIGTVAGERRGIRALLGARVILYGDINVDGPGAALSQGATGIRAAWNSHVTVNGNVAVSGNRSVGIWIQRTGTTVSVNGTVGHTGESSQQVLIWIREGTMGPNVDNIYIGGQRYTGEGRPAQPPSGGNNQQPDSDSGSDDNYNDQPVSIPSSSTPPVTSPPTILATGNANITFTQYNSRVSLSISSNNANTIIREASDRASFDLTGISGADTAILTRTIWRQFANAGLDLEFALPHATITVDNAAARSIGQRAGANSVEISILPVIVSDLAEVQQHSLLPGDQLLQVVAASNGTNIADVYGNLIVSISVGATNPVAIRRINDDGTWERVQLEFDAESEKVTFYTGSLGIFAIGEGLFEHETSEVQITPEVQVPSDRFIQLLPPAPLAQARFAIGNYVYSINGISSTFEVAPFIDSAYNRTMLPLRLVGYALDATFQWDETTGTAIMFLGGTSVNVAVGQPLPNNMGTAVIINDRMFVPARYVSEALGATVRWDESNQAVYIYR